jgi:hypothetical protein
VALTTMPCASVLACDEAPVRPRQICVCTIDSFFVFNAVILNMANDILNRFSQFIQHYGMR